MNLFWRNFVLYLNFNRLFTLVVRQPQPFTFNLRAIEGLPYASEISFPFSF